VKDNTYIGKERRPIADDEATSESGSLSANCGFPIFVYHHGGLLISRRLVIGADELIVLRLTVW
jgi:hypothetical protein